MMSQDIDPRGMLKRRLLRGEITYATAKEQDANILHQLGYRDQKIRYFTEIPTAAATRRSTECISSPS